ncbi:DUF2066 domain-containing protein [Pseudidiomarina tainanensis]|jgi:hypothetical protein|uniref:DUF2066 domain-containing protein n=1 Tax=Pseudidiomarina tainanensis TaxID=502365 RepID=UPI0013EE9D86|nr:DUF2066 domain-containing protein [Pseudidiomarina tainanensis]
MRTLKIAVIGLFIIALNLLTPLQTGHAAVEVKQLYQARVAVTSQATSERNEALRTALTNTLLKVSGDDAVLEHESVQLALQNVRNFVVQYGYQQAADELLLWVQFDQPQIDRVIQQADSGVWSSRRPELLFWVVAEDENLQRQILGGGEDWPVINELRKAAQTRGLPVKLPLLDLNDSMSISVVDLWARFEDRITFASSRYDADGVVVARLYQADSAITSDEWMLDWTLELGGMRWRGEVSAMQPELLGGMLVADVTQQLSQRFRIGTNADMAGTWRIKVNDLSQFMDVLRAEKLLLELPSVNRVQLMQYGEHEAEFELYIQTDPAQIMQAIDLSRTFIPINPERRSEFEMPVYRWSQS